MVKPYVLRIKSAAGQDWVSRFQDLRSPELRRDWVRKEALTEWQEPRALYWQDTEHYITAFTTTTAQTTLACSRGGLNKRHYISPS
jgi:hypothetical protein